MISTDKHQILSRIEQYLRAQEHLHARLGPANQEVCSEFIQTFTQVLEEYMHSHAVRSLSSNNEATLQGVVEMLGPPRISIVENTSTSDPL